jgi:serine/threonine protein phosphatase 1
MNYSNRRVIIGDVHGHYQGLMLLLDQVASTSDDQIYFLGDLIDRGPDSSQVVDFVKENNYPCVLGNHEQMLLNLVTSKELAAQTMNAWLFSGGQATLASYKNAIIPQEHLEWFHNLPIYLDLGDIWLAHAGLDPKKSVAEQTAYQLCWIRESFHSMEESYFPNKTIIVGHTITFTLPDVSPGKLAQGRGWIDIDTGAYHPRSGWLTGLDMTYKLVYQVNVFSHEVRTLSLEEAITIVDPMEVKLTGRC